MEGSWAGLAQQHHCKRIQCALLGQLADSIACVRRCVGVVSYHNRKLIRITPRSVTSGTIPILPEGDYVDRAISLRSSPNTILHRETIHLSQKIMTGREPPQLNQSN
jgi:hypothetical protein